MTAAERLRPLTEQATEFERSVLGGLGLPQKRLEAKFFYDEAGSRLFDRICELEEYYPTRTETGILRDHAHRLAPLLPESAALVELGSGSSVKTRLLLEALPRFTTYVPLDISAEHLRAAAARIAADYPVLGVEPLVADFTAPLAMPARLRDRPKVVFFPGSTIGNFSLPEAQALLSRLCRLSNVVALIVGADLRKDLNLLIRAYDDAAGVTAAFNKNLLVRMNRELGANFDLTAFGHKAHWNEEQSRIEMHLVSERRQVVDVAQHSFDFEAGETIHTENSHKFSVCGFKRLAKDAGWASADVWVDRDEWFSVHVLVPEPEQLRGMAHARTTAAPCPAAQSRSPR